MSIKTSKSPGTLTWDEYRLLASRTCPDLDLKYRGEDMLGDSQRTREEHSIGNLFNSLHTTVGMSTELGELYDCFYPKKRLFVDRINFGEEIGDVCWYLAIYSNLHSIPTCEKPLSLSNETIEDYLYLLNSKIGYLLDLDKRHFAYGKYNEGKRVQYVHDILRICKCLAYSMELDFKEILYKNIKKLAIRYPNKFNTEDATIRNLVEERKLLEE